MSTRRWCSPETDGGFRSDLVGAKVASRHSTIRVEPATLPKMAVAPGVPACAGMSEVFDSTERRVTETARAVCARCPVLSWCASEARHAVDARLPIEGTWAGVAYSAGRALRTGVSDDS